MSKYIIDNVSLSVSTGSHKNTVVSVGAQITSKHLLTIQTGPAGNVYSSIQDPITCGEIDQESRTKLDADGNPVMAYGAEVKVNRDTVEGELARRKATAQRLGTLSCWVDRATLGHKELCTLVESSNDYKIVNDLMDRDSLVGKAKKSLSSFNYLKPFTRDCNTAQFSTLNLTSRGVTVGKAVSTSAKGVTKVNVDGSDLRTILDLVVRSDPPRAGELSDEYDAAVKAQLDRASAPVKWLFTDSSCRGVANAWYSNPAAYIAISKSMVKQWPDERSLRYASVAAFCGACAKVGITDGLKEFLAKFGSVEIKSAQAPVTTLGYWISDLPSGTGRTGRSSIPVVMGAVSTFDTTRLVPQEVARRSVSARSAMSDVANAPARQKSPDGGKRGRAQQPQPQAQQPQAQQQQAQAQQQQQQQRPQFARGNSPPVNQNRPGNNFNSAPLGNMQQ